MNFNFFNNLMLLGTIQGVIFAIFIFSKKKYKNRANFALAFLILSFAFDSLQFYIYDTQLLSENQFYSFVYLPFAFICPVFYFLYVDFLVGEKKEFTKKKSLLFLPFIISLIPLSYYRFRAIIEGASVEIAEKIMDLELWFETLANLYSFLLLVYCFFVIQKFSNEQQSKIDSRKLPIRWLRNTTIILFVICLLWGVSTYYDTQNYSTVSFYFLWVGLAFSIYWLGYYGIYIYGIREEQKKLRKFSADERITVTENISQSKVVSSFERYILEEKNYLNSNLTLDLVAVDLGVNKSYLSRLIHSELGTSFTDYINKLRVEEVKKYIQNPDFKNYTLVAIGIEAGFNSKSAFNNAFKKFTGNTPSEFRKK